MRRMIVSGLKPRFSGVTFPLLSFWAGRMRTVCISEINLWMSDCRTSLTSILQMLIRRKEVM